MTIKFDLHGHTKYSCDSNIEPKEIAKRSIKNGVNVVAVTDHNTIKGGLATKKYETKNFKVIVGSEISTIPTGGEVIGLFLTEEIKRGSLEEVIENIRAQNGIVIVPHPFDTGRESALHPSNKQAKLFDGIEGFNARCNVKEYDSISIEYGKKHNLTLVAGSDSHIKSEIGNAWNITECESVREAIEKNNLEFGGIRTPHINRMFSRGIKKWRKTATVLHIPSSNTYIYD